MAFIRTKNGVLIDISEIKYLTQLKLLRGGYAYLVMTSRANPNDPAHPIVQRFEVEIPDAKELKKSMLPYEGDEVSDQAAWVRVDNPVNANEG